MAIVVKKTAKHYFQVFITLEDYGALLEISKEYHLKPNELLDWIITEGIEDRSNSLE